MIKVGVIDPQPDSASGYYRGWGPLHEWSRQSQRSVEFIPLPSMQWSTLTGVDAVYMRAPVGKNAITVASHVLKLCPVLWVDFDDALDLLPDTFPIHMKLGSQKEVFTEVSKLATILTTSSMVMYARWLTDPELKNKVHYVPNALNLREVSRYIQLAKDQLSLKERIDRESKEKILWWRGGQSHYENFATYLPALTNDMMLKHKAKLVTQGYDFFGAPMASADIHPSRKQLNLPFDECYYKGYIPWTTIPDCFIQSMNLSPDVCMVMHNKHVFNECRSNSAWIEACVAGAVSVVPDTPEWEQLPGVYRYRVGDVKDFSRAVDEALALSAKDRYDKVCEGYDYIIKNRTLANTNQQRHEILMKVLGMPCQQEEE